MVFGTWMHCQTAYSDNEKCTGPISSTVEVSKYKDSCGEYYDAETGTYYLRTRYYDPAIGRFTQEDPRWNTLNMLYGDELLQLNHDKRFPDLNSIVQAQNLYAYVRNNPVSYKDETGEIIVSAIVTGAVVGGVINAGVNDYGQLKERAPFEQLNSSSIGVSFTSGAISGGITGSPIGTLGQIGLL